jgi:hypothetical protein
MSRKLLFLSGIVSCFTCHTRFRAKEERVEFYRGKPVEAVIHQLREVLSAPPLEIVASALIPHEELDGSVTKMFSAYDEFVGMLADETKLENGLTKREHLDLLSVDEIEGDEIADQARKLSHRFRDGISEIFLTKDTELGRLTIEYGVF